MKKIIVLIGMIGILNHATAAENPTDTVQLKNEFNISVTKFFLSTFSVGYERLFKNATGLQLNAEAILLNELDTEILGYSAGLQYRIYSMSEAIDLFSGSTERIYMGPYASYRYVEHNPVSGEDGHSGVVHSLSTGILLGIKMTVLNKVFFDFSLGGGVQYSNGTLDSGDETYFSYDAYLPEYSGIKPKANIAIGIKF